MTEPKFDEPLISKETWSLSMMNQLNQTLKEIDGTRHSPGQNPLAEICNWNGLMGKLYEIRKDTAPPEKVKIKAKKEFEQDPQLAKLVDQKPFQALAFIDNLNRVLDEVNPDYKMKLPRLRGLVHQLESLLIETGFKPEKFDRAFTKITVGL